MDNKYLLGLTGPPLKDCQQNDQRGQAVIGSLETWDELGLIDLPLFHRYLKKTGISLRRPATWKTAANVQQRIAINFWPLS